MLYCVVCQDLIDDNAHDGNYPWTLQCGHIFHKNCIPQELLDYTCPQCREPAVSSFRLYPSIEHRDQTISLLRSCVDAVQEMYLQQKSLAEQKEEVIKTLTTQNEQCQSKVLELQGSYLTYTNEHDGQIKGFNDEINKITEEKERLMGEIRSHKEEMGQHSVTFQTLQDKLKRQRDLFQTMNELKQESEDLLNEIVETFNQQTATDDQSPETGNENIEDTNSRNDNGDIAEETSENEN